MSNPRTCHAVLLASWPPIETVSDRLALAGHPGRLGTAPSRARSLTGLLDRGVGVNRRRRVLLRVGPERLQRSFEPSRQIRERLDPDVHD